LNSNHLKKTYPSDIVRINCQTSFLKQKTKKQEEKETKGISTEKQVQGRWAGRHFTLHCFVLELTNDTQHTP
jgi:hypothetical protein